MRFGVPCAAIVAAAIFAAPPLHAGDAGEAKAMFDHGLDEMKRGHLDAACPLFADSYKKNPLPGALFTLAECEAKRGKIATAVKRYEEYLALHATLPKDKLAKQRGRDTQSKDQITLLLPQIPKVTLLVPDAAKEGIVITIDGVPVDRGAIGSPLPIDPGDHVVFAQPRGGSAVEAKISIARSEQKTVPIELETQAQGTEAPGKGSSTSALRIAGIAVGSTGLAAIVVGAVTGGMALAKKSVIGKNCVFDEPRGVATCNEAGLSAGQGVKTLGGVSTGTFIAGAALAGAGMAMFLLGRADAPRDARAIPLVAIAHGQTLLGVTGVF